MKLASLFFSAFLLLLGYCFYPVLQDDDHRGQLLAAYLTLPTSALVLSFSNSMLDVVGPFGTPLRRIAEWCLLMVCGLQYFFLGLLISRATNRVSTPRDGRQLK